MSKFWQGLAWMSYFFSMFVDWFGKKDESAHFSSVSLMTLACFFMLVAIADFLKRRIR